MQNYLDYVLEDSWLKTSVFIILFLLIPELESAKQKYYFSSYSCLKYKSAYLVVYSRFLTFQFTCLCVHLLLNNFETSSLGMNTTKSNYDLTLTLLFHVYFEFLKRNRRWKMVWWENAIGKMAKYRTGNINLWWKTRQLLLYILIYWQYLQSN